MGYTPANIFVPISDGVCELLYLDASVLTPRFLPSIRPPFDDEAPSIRSRKRAAKIRHSERLKSIAGVASLPWRALAPPICF